MSDFEYEEPDWRGEEVEIPAELDPISRNIVEILLKSEIRTVKMEVWVPFSCNQEQKYLLGYLYEGPGRRWYIEGKEHLGKFKDPQSALHQMIEDLEISRQRMMNEEFNQSI